MNVSPGPAPYAPSAGPAWGSSATVDASSYGIIEEHDGRPYTDRVGERPKGSSLIQWTVGLLLLAAALTFMLWITWILFG